MAAPRRSGPRGPRGPRFVEPVIKNRINEDIIAQEVRVVGFDDESRNGIYRTSDAIRIAQEEGKDLVEIAPNAVPPVCRIIQYSKFRYELKKREKELKSKQHTMELKEIRFSPNTDEHDFNFKLKHASKFLEEGDKVKATVTFHGRSIVYKERGEKLLLEFALKLEELAKVEALPKLEGKRMFMILQPKLIKKK